MATRTSSPPASRNRGRSSTGSTSSTATTRSSGSRSGRKPAQKGRSKRRPSPRAVRNGTGPVATLGLSLGRGVVALWLGVAHLLGAGVRKVGRTARDLEPEHRRDGVGLFLFGLAVVVAAAVWWQLPGGLTDAVRTVVAGSVGKVGWLVPLILVWIGWRNMRDPETNGPGGRQVVGWVALGFGVLGVVHIAAGNPQPVNGDTSDLQDAGGAIGYVVSSLLLDLLRTAYVVVPVLLLLAFFGVLVITATPVYQVPAKLRALRDRLLGRTPVDESDLPENGVRSRRRGLLPHEEHDPGDPAYDSPVLSERELQKRRKRGAPDDAVDADATQALAVADPQNDPDNADTATDLIPPPHTPLPQRAEQLELSG